MISAGVSGTAPTDTTSISGAVRPCVSQKVPDVFWEVTAPELGDRDCLSFTVSLGEAVALLEFLGPERARPGRRVAGAGEPSGHPALIQPEHARDHAVEVGRDVNLTFAATEDAVGAVIVESETGTKSVLDLPGGAAHREAPGRRICLLDAQPEPPEDALDLLAGVREILGVNGDRQFDGRRRIDVADMRGVRLLAAFAALQSHVTLRRHR